MKGHIDMRWIPIGRKTMREIIESHSATVANEYDREALFWTPDGIVAIRRIGERFYMYETAFSGTAEIDVTEIQPGDVIWHCLDDGPVKSHEPYCAYPETEELVFWESGSDRFGKPQKVEVLRECVF